MRVTPIKTEKVTPDTGSLLSLLDTHLHTFPEGSVLAITSKIVAICEGRLVKLDQAGKEDLVRQESQRFLPAALNRYGVMLTITDSLLIASAGIDESNSNGYFILWPQDAQQTANSVREYLVKRFRVQRAGVVITDSKTTPLRWGTSGMSLAHSGFEALNDYIGHPDIFGRNLKMTKANVMDGLGAAAVLVMGEGEEQTPVALIEDLPFVRFQDRNPTEAEVAALRIAPEDDLYATLLNSVQWEPGEK